MKSVLSFLILLFFVVNVYAQEVFELEEFVVSDEQVCMMTRSNEDVVAFMTNSPSGIAIKKYQNDGVLQDSILLWTRKQIDSTLRIVDYELFCNALKQPVVYYVSKPIGTDTATFHKITISEDMTPVVEDYDWFRIDCPERVGDSKEVQVIVNNDGGVFLSYETIQDSIRIVRFNSVGVVMAERTIERHPQQFVYSSIPTSDSLGIHIVKWRTDTTAYQVYGCYTFDSNLNLENRIDDLDVVSRPTYCSEYAYHRFNPNAKKTYSISSTIDPIYSNNGQCIVMSMFDKNMNQLKYTWGVVPGHRDFAGIEHTIDFDSDNKVYMAGSLEYTTNVYIVCMDEELNKLGEIYFVHPERSQFPVNVLAYSEGGCLVACWSSEKVESYVYKVTLSDLLDVEEAHSHGFAVATAYPNPGKDVLNIRTGLQNAWVEVYDMNGRLVHRQEITENVTAINAETWPAGIYVWKMISDGKEVENGKWIKE